MTPAFHKLLSKVTHWTHNVLGDGTQEEDHIQEDTNVTLWRVTKILTSKLCLIY